jgi:hypothetical protein
MKTAVAAGDAATASAAKRAGDDQSGKKADVRIEVMQIYDPSQP